MSLEEAAKLIMSAGLVGPAGPGEAQGAPPHPAAPRRPDRRKAPARV